MADLFCTSEGSRGRLPFALGRLSRSRRPLWRCAPGGLTVSPPLRVLPSRRTFQVQGEPDRPLSRPWTARQGGPSGRPGPGVRAAASSAGRDPGVGGRGRSAGCTGSPARAEATPAGRGLASQGCSRSRRQPSPGRLERGRTALQWPSRQTARVPRSPAFSEKGCPSAAFEHVALLTPSSSHGRPKLPFATVHPDGRAGHLLPPVVLKLHQAPGCPGQLVQTHVAGSHTEGRRICISNKIPEAAAATGPRTTFTEPRAQFAHPVRGLLASLIEYILHLLGTKDKKRP